MMEFVLHTYPWAAALPGEELTAFANELGTALGRWDRTRDAASCAEWQAIVADWHATVEARANRGLQEARARPHRTFVPWE